MILNVYDLDKTLIQGDSNELWHEFLLELGILDEHFIQEDKRLMDLYAKGVLDMDKYLEFAVTALNTTTQEKINELMGDFLEKKIRPIIYKETFELIKNAKHKLIISATPEFIVSPIARYLGIEDCIGMRLKLKNGFFTSEYEKPLSYKEGKVHCLQNYIKQKDLNPKKIIFYSDSINDLPLLEYANEAFCVNPDEKLKQIAMHNDWTIYNWSC